MLTPCDSERDHISNGVINHRMFNPIPSKERCTAKPNCFNLAEPIPVDAYNKVAPVSQDAATRKRLPNTELFGGAFRGQDGGDGLFSNPDTWSDLWAPPDDLKGCDKHLSEVNFNRFDHVDAPMAWEGSWWGGIDTRQGEQRFSKCDN